MSKYEQWVRDRQRVQARLAVGESIRAEGRVIAYCDAPTVTIETDDGTHVSWRADLTEPIRAFCEATEGATGITCQLPRFHGKEVDHEGAHDPATAGHDGIGYRLTVRWPWNEWDRDYAAVQGEEYPEISGAGVLYSPSESLPGQDLCRQDECPAAPRCSSGATVWHTRTSQCTPPLHVDNEAIVMGEYFVEKARQQTGGAS
jgi:hypothetical protein